jgi:hypothetical protein
MWACHPILWAITVAFAIWAALFSYEYYVERKVISTPGVVITLTPWKRDMNGKIKTPAEVHEFDPRLEHYLKVTEVIIGLASASLVSSPLFMQGTSTAGSPSLSSCWALPSSLASLSWRQ